MNVYDSCIIGKIQMHITFLLNIKYNVLHHHKAQDFIYTSR